MDQYKIYDEISKLLQSQNDEREIIITMISSESTIDINIATDNIFLQIDDLDLILKDTSFNKINFNIEHHSTINIQSFNYEYSIILNNDCTTHSFNLMKSNKVFVELGENCTCIHKGNHIIKTGKNCVIESALKRN